MPLCCGADVKVLLLSKLSCGCPSFQPPMHPWHGQPCPLQAFLRHYARLPTQERQLTWRQVEACGAASQAQAFVLAALRTEGV